MASASFLVALLMSTWARYSGHGTRTQTSTHKFAGSHLRFNDWHEPMAKDLTCSLKLLSYDGCDSENNRPFSYSVPRVKDISRQKSAPATHTLAHAESYEWTRRAHDVARVWHPTGLACLMSERILVPKTPAAEARVMSASRPGFGCS